MLEVLLNDTFAGLVSLTHLDLSNNKLVFYTNAESTLLPSQVPARPGTLLGLPLAITTWLQGRHKTSNINEGPHTAIAKSQYNSYLPFAGLVALQYLDLANNGIRILRASQWRDLRQLIQLSLRRNDVREWYAPVFSNLSLLKVLDLSYNSLSSVTEDMLQDFSLVSLESVDLSNNPFKCDCSLRKFVEAINTSILVEFPTYRCSLEGADLSLEEYIGTTPCAPERPVDQVEEPESTAPKRLEIIVFSVSLLLSVVTTVTLYRKRW